MNIEENKDSVILVGWRRRLSHGQKVFLLLLVCAVTGWEVASPSQIDISKFLSCNAIIIIRHAEVLQSNKDHLTGAGTNRACQLTNVLANVEITKIFVSDQNRTRETAQFLAQRSNLPSQPILLDECNTQDTIRRISDAIDTNDTVLIVFHHTKIPALVHALTTRDAVDCDQLPNDNIGEKEFDRMYVLYPDAKKEKLKLLLLHYGEPPTKR